MNDMPFGPLIEDLARKQTREFDRQALESVKNRFFDILQAHIVIAGGSKLSVADLKMMPLGSVVDMIWPNDINLVVVNNKMK